MKPIIFIADVHADYKEPYWSGTQKLFDYLTVEYAGCTLVCAGDWYSNSSPHNVVAQKMTEYALKFERFYVINGNHDYSRQKDSALLQLRNHPSIVVMTQPTELEIEKGVKTLFLPYVYTEAEKEMVNKVKGVYDIVVSHLTPKCDSYGGEYYDTKVKANIGIIWGHIHEPKNFTDDLGNKNYILGVPQPTREGEQNHKPNIAILENGKLTLKELPVFMTISTIKYGDKIEHGDYLYNITDAPDIQSVYEMYKGYHVREDGISLKETVAVTEAFSFNKSSIQSQFKTWAVEQGLSQEIVDCGIAHLDKVLTG